MKDKISQKIKNQISGDKKSSKINRRCYAEQDIKLIIGLGNPGEEYAGTYHNAGFLAIDRIIEIQNAKCETQNYPKQIALRFNGAGKSKFKIIKCDNSTFIKPLTFMNESGNAVKEAIGYFSLKPENILIIHDDSDIELGSYKFSFGRGSAGHKGIESIIKNLKTKNFWRLRIGIGGLKKNSKRKAGEFVLKKINKKNLEILNKTFSECLKAFPFKN